MSDTTLKKSAPERNTGADCPNKDTDKFYESDQDSLPAAILSAFAFTVFF